VTAAKLYMLGGLVIVLVIVSVTWYGTWRAWGPALKTGSASDIVHSTVVFPVALALGLIAIVLGLSQQASKVQERVKFVGAIAYLLGAVLFPLAMYNAVSRADWGGRVGIMSFVGAALVAMAIFLNLVGVLLYGRKNETEV
jgi:hypothetical protein